MRDRRKRREHTVTHASVFPLSTILVLAFVMFIPVIGSSFVENGEHTPAEARETTEPVAGKRDAQPTPVVTGADPRRITKGDRIRLPKNGRIVVKNPDDIQNEDRRFVFEERCKIAKGDFFEVIRTTSNSAFVRYQRELPATGDQCPSGAIALFKIQELERARTLSLKQDQEREARRMRVRRLIQNDDDSAP